VHRVTHTKIDHVSLAFLESNPLVDGFSLTIKQQKFPSFKEFGEQQKTSRDTQKRHEREDNGN